MDDFLLSSSGTLSENVGYGNWDGRMASVNIPSLQFVQRIPFGTVTF